MLLKLKSIVETFYITKQKLCFKIKVKILLLLSVVLNTRSSYEFLINFVCKYVIYSNLKLKLYF